MFSRLLRKFGLIKATLITTLMVVTTSLIITFVINTLISRPITIQTILVSIFVPFFVASPFIYNHFSLLLKLVESEQLLKKNATNYKNLINNIPGIVYQGHLDGTTEIISESNGLGGYTETEINSLKRGWLDIVHPEDIKTLKEQNNTSSREEKSSIQTYRIISKNGGIKWVQDLKKSFYSHDGKFLGVEGIIFDITERHKMEEHLRRTHNIESIGILAGGLAHDFNNILAAIIGNINLALFDTDLKDRTKNLLTEAEKASLRATDLTRQLLTFAKGGEPVKESASLESVIKDSANFVLHGDKVACHYDIPEDLWSVDIDKAQIGQVIQNIALNASHAMPDGGTISVACENIASISTKELPFAEDGRFVKLSIQDNGIGMPANIVEKIFDPYFSTKHEGNGLGLAITQSIINKHNGYITAESSPDIGTTFTIYLPASEKIKPQKQELLIEKHSASQVKIMIMDDEEMVRAVAQKMLVQLGHEVVLSEDGEQALKLYRESYNTNNKFDLVIMDLTIPGGMGGEETVQKILDFDPEAKVIVSSGYSNDPIMANYKDYGFCSAIVKPYRLQELDKLISQLTDL